MSPFDHLPYRPCAGIALFNASGKVFVGRRLDGPEEAEGAGRWWQMPQGGIDDGEDLEAAAQRELFEETNVSSIALLGVHPEWLLYDLPPELLGKAWRGKYRGQRIRYVAFRFEGKDSEIDIHRPGAGAHKPEFTDWRWETLAALPDVIVPFKRDVYRSVVQAFRRFAE